jgi:2-dehydro-3-deoxygluconokinase
VVLKTGADGAWFKTADGEQGAVAAVKVENVVDTVGAGDGFAVGVISALLEGKPLHQAVARGNKIGSLAIQVQGDSEGLPHEHSSNLNSLSLWERARVRAITRTK